MLKNTRTEFLSKANTVSLQWKAVAVGLLMLGGGAALTSPEPQPRLFSETLTMPDAPASFCGYPATICIPARAAGPVRLDPKSVWPSTQGNLEKAYRSWGASQLRATRAPGG